MINGVLTARPRSRLPARFLELRHGGFGDAAAGPVGRAVHA